MSRIQFGANGCQALVGGQPCGETETLEIIQQFKMLYESKMQKIEDEAGGGDCVPGLQAKVSLQQEWIRDLTQQNELLVRAVEELEQEATDRVAMLEAKLRTSVCRGAEVMQKYRDFCFSPQNLEYLQSDVCNLLEFIRRVRDEGSWSICGLHFNTICIADVLGKSLCSARAHQGPEEEKDAAELEKQAQVVEDIQAKMQEMPSKEDLDDMVSKLQETEQELTAVKRSMMDMRNALTIEVADKHDIILNLRRDVQQLEEQCRQSNKQTQFKDDIIKELRKEIKHLKTPGYEEKLRENMQLQNNISQLMKELGVLKDLVARCSGDSEHDESTERFKVQMFESGRSSGVKTKPCLWHKSEMQSYTPRNRLVHFSSNCECDRSMTCRKLKIMNRTKSESTTATTNSSSNLDSDESAECLKLKMIIKDTDTDTSTANLECSKFKPPDNKLQKVTDLSSTPEQCRFVCSTPKASNTGSQEVDDIKTLAGNDCVLFFRMAKEINKLLQDAHEKDKQLLDQQDVIELLTEKILFFYNKLKELETISSKYRSISIEGDAAALKGRLEEAEGEMKVLKDTIAEANRELEKLYEQANEYLTERDEYKRKLNDCSAKLAALQGDLKAANEEFAKTSQLNIETIEALKKNNEANMAVLERTRRDSEAVTQAQNETIEALQEALKQKEQFVGESASGASWQTTDTDKSVQSGVVAGQLKTSDFIIEPQQTDYPESVGTEMGSSKGVQAESGELPGAREASGVREASVATEARVAGVTPVAGETPVAGVTTVAGKPTVAGEITVAGETSGAEEAPGADQASGADESTSGILKAEEDGTPEKQAKQEARANASCREAVFPASGEIICECMEEDEGIPLKEDTKRTNSRGFNVEPQKTFQKEDTERTNSRGFNVEPQKTFTKEDTDIDMDRAMRQGSIGELQQTLVKEDTDIDIDRAMRHGSIGELQRTLEKVMKEREVERTKHSQQLANLKATIAEVERGPYTMKSSNQGADIEFYQNSLNVLQASEERAKIEVTQLRLTIANLQEALVASKNQLDQFQQKASSEVHQYVQYVNDLKNVMSAVDDQCLLYCKKIKSLKTLVEHLRDTNLDLEVENFGYVQDVAMLETRLLKYQFTIKNEECVGELQNELIQQQAQNTHLKQHLCALTCELTAMQRVINEAKQLHLKFMELEEAHENQIHQNDIIRQELIREAKLSEIDTARIDELQQMLCEKTCKLNHYEQQFYNAQRKLDCTLNQNQELKNEVAQLIKHIKKYEQSCIENEERTENCEQEIEECRRCLGEMKNNLMSIGELLHEKIEQYNQLESNYHVQGNALECLKQQLAGKHNQKDDVEELMRTNENLTCQVSCLQTSMTSNQQNSQAKLSKCLEELKALRAQRLCLEARSEQYKTELQDMQTAYDELSQSYNQLLKSVITLETELVDSKTDRDKVCVESRTVIGNVRAWLQDQAFINEQLKHKLNNDAVIICRLKSKIETLEAWKCKCCKTLNTPSPQQPVSCYNPPPSYTSQSNTASSADEMYLYDETEDDYMDDECSPCPFIKRVENMTQQLQKSNQYWQSQMGDRDYMVTRDQ